jgi:2-polyprenyl-3-methyl-5-hydroxy-6-metoxy-1,4-benzoquinol methylase
MAALVSTAATAPDFTRRSDESEWLDGADLNPDELAAVLRDLARFNGAMLGHRPVLSWLARAVECAPKGEALTLVDVGCGYGDLLRAIRRWAARRGVPMRLIGLDLSRAAIGIAAAATDHADDIEYRVADVFAFRPDTPIDFVVSSLLTHHFSDAMIVAFLGWMETNARRGWFIYDLQRHAVPYHFIGLAGRLMRLHPTVVHDGRISVARSLTANEWYSRLAEAGLAQTAQLRWFLYRFAVGRLR